MSDYPPSAIQASPITGAQGTPILSEQEGQPTRAKASASPNAWMRCLTRVGGLPPSDGNTLVAVENCVVPWPVLPSTGGASCLVIAGGLARPPASFFGAATRCVSRSGELAKHRACVLPQSPQDRCRVGLRGFNPTCRCLAFCVENVS